MKFQVITAEGRGLRHSLLQLVDVTVIGVSLSSVRFARLFPLFIPQNVRNTHSDFALPLDINSFYSSLHPGGLLSTNGHFKTYIARCQARLHPSQYHPPDRSPLLFLQD